MSRLFEPMKLGSVALDHRIALAPLTRFRMDDTWKATTMSRGKEIITHFSALAHPFT